MMVARRALIVDGYNVIRQTPPYRELAEQDLDAARAALINDVAAFSHGDFDTLVVFDAGANPHSDGAPHEVSGIHVVFSPFGVDADTVVEQRARKARDEGRDVDVVTSDAQTQWAVLGGSVARRSAAEFAGELRSGSAEWRDHAPAGSSASRIEDRIDPRIRDTLGRWARGEP